MAELNLLQISNKYLNLYQRPQHMHEIRARVDKLLATDHISGYREAVDYLLGTLERTLNQSDADLERQFSRNLGTVPASQAKAGRRPLIAELFQTETKSNPETQKQPHELSCSQYAGSKISFISAIKHHGRHREAKVSSKFNKRGIQQTIMIYHQCLEKALETVKLLHRRSQQHSPNIVSKHIRNVEQFWLKYNEAFQSSQTFDDLITISRQILAEQFLTIIKPIMDIKARTRLSYHTPVILINQLSQQI